MRSIKDFIVEFWPSMIVLGVILYATLASNPVDIDDMPPIPYLDKLIHAIMMGGFTGAIAFDITRHAPKAQRHVVLTSSLMWRIFIGIAIFGILDEIAQATLTDTRGAEVADFFADCAGSVVAVFTAPAAIRKVLKMQ